MHTINKIVLIGIIFLACGRLIEAEDVSYYAIVKVDGKKKLYTMGDMFCSRIYITDCLRIQEIKEDSLGLIYVDSKETLTLRPGQSLPLKGTNVVFEKAVNTDIVRHRNKDFNKKDSR